MIRKIFSRLQNADRCRGSTINTRTVLSSATMLAQCRSYNSNNNNNYSKNSDYSNRHSSHKRHPVSSTTESKPTLHNSEHHASVKNMIENKTVYKSILTLINANKYQEAVDLFESAFIDPQTQSLTDLCALYEVRDMLLSLTRLYTSLGKMDKVRELFMLGLRDLDAQEVKGVSPLVYVGGNSSSSTSSSAAGGKSASLSLDALSSAAGQQEGKTDASARIINRNEPLGDPITWQRPSLLNVSFFNMYLEVLTVRKNYDKNEVLFVLKKMKEAGVEPNALTYHYLIEIHIRAGYNPKALWKEMMVEKQLSPLPATLQALMDYVVPHVQDSIFVVEITREALRCGSSVVSKKRMTELIESWLRGNAESSKTKGHQAAKTHPALHRYPPEYVMWLMLELELRCVLDKASFSQYITKVHIAELLVQCAKSADAETADKVIALMDRHVMTKTADILALVVWCWSSAVAVGRALDLVEVMARKGYLDGVDPFKRYVIETLRFPMERNPILAVVDAISSANLLDVAYNHLLKRKREGEPVTVHTLDIILLACSKLGEDRRALHLVSTYSSEWGVSPRANTFNALLVGNANGRGTLLLRNIYDAMLQSGVSPNIRTFRVLIRQSVLLDNIDEAVYYLQQVTKHTNLRVEVEMILPILERAARAGDVETVNQISQYSLDCDIGIDTNVINNLMSLLAEAGQSVEVLKGHQPLHEALRSRSTVGRQRARNEISL